MTASASAEPRTLYCSFCGKSQHDLEKLIAGPGVFICNECVGLCNDILIGRPISPTLPSWDEVSDDELLRRMASVAASRDQVEQVLTEAVRRLRTRGVTWARIGETLGMTRQSAWERFSGEE